METPKGLRCFIAIELPDEVKSALSRLLNEIKNSGADVRWAKAENIHLTLKFLGNVEEKDIPKIVNVMSDICKKYPSFNLEVKGTGMFPDRKFPRVLWVGVEGNNILRELQKDIEHEAAKIGFEKEDRKFTAHLTLGRFRSQKNKDTLLNEIERYSETGFGRIDVKTISLIKSELNPGGAEYFRLSEVSLR